MNVGPQVAIRSCDGIVDAEEEVKATIFLSLSVKFLCNRSS
jgi:hypothetical protein